MAAPCPGSNELLDDRGDPVPSAEFFEQLVREHGREEAGRRWLALFGAYDDAQT